MRRLAWWLCSAAVLACAGGTGSADTGVVVFTFGSHLPGDTMQVAVTNPTTIATARAVLAGASNARIPIGPIVRGAGIDPRYPFHFIADSVRLVEVAIELCDGRPMRTAAEVDSFIAAVTGDPAAPSATWCPWQAEPHAVIESPAPLPTAETASGPHTPPR